MKKIWGYDDTKKSDTWAWRIISTGYLIFTPSFWIGTWKRILFWIGCIVLGFIIGKYS